MSRTDKLSHTARCKRTYHTTAEELCILYSHKIFDEDSIEPPPLTHAEIEACRERAATPGERQRWQVILMLTDKIPITEIEAQTGYRPRTIRQIAQRYRDRGPEGLKDGRTHSKGASPILSQEDQQELRLAIRAAPPGGGVWTGPKVARWIADKTGKQIHRQRGWEYLRRLRLDE